MKVVVDSEIDCCSSIMGRCISLTGMGFMNSEMSHNHNCRDRYFPCLPSFVNRIFITDCNVLIAVLLERKETYMKTAFMVILLSV